MNIDHLNFVVEARYYGYWIALVFAIICSLMFVCVKILDAREQKERLNAERKKIQNDTILTKELVRKLSGFFMLEENCRGYDPNTPIGEIAEHALRHWQRHDQEVYELQKTKRRIADLLELEKEKVADARKIACDYQNVICDFEKKLRHVKYKRCLVMAELCQWKMGVFIYKKEKNDFYYRWHKRWLELADKFKE